MRKFASTLVFALVLSVFAVSASWAEEVLIKGSDTLLNLVQQLSEAYMKQHTSANITVVGGGSGVGISALIDGNVDIANSSRDIKESEINKAKANNVNPMEIAIAIDGLAVIVNPENSTDKLTVEQLGAIYRGEVTNWKEVGGPDMKINLYGRQPSSGTFVFFMEHVLEGDYLPRMRQMTGNAQIVDSIKRDKSGIGYVGLGYIKEIKGIKVLSIGKKHKDKPLEYVSPKIFIEPLKPGAERPEYSIYPLMRPLYQYTNGAPKDVTKDFIKFELSEKGQEIVEKVGFLRLSDKQVAKSMKILEIGK